jgi:hypothetical protein
MCQIQTIFDRKFLDVCVTIRTICGGLVRELVGGGPTECCCAAKIAIFFVCMWRNPNNSDGLVKVCVAVQTISHCGKFFASR